MRTAEHLLALIKVILLSLIAATCLSVYSRKKFPRRSHWQIAFKDALRKSETLEKNIAVIVIIASLVACCSENRKCSDDLDFSELVELALAEASRRLTRKIADEALRL